MIAYRKVLKGNQSNLNDVWLLVFICLLAESLGECTLYVMPSFQQIYLTIPKHVASHFALLFRPVLNKYPIYICFFRIQWFKNDLLMCFMSRAPQKPTEHIFVSTTTIPPTHASKHHFWSFYLPYILYWKSLRSG